ncbi:MAG: hypothetical protein NTY45_16780 [Elusimicrobia bacterium]|nr:hypothetical protein [Elusimicrobiota bacterium]
MRLIPIMFAAGLIFSGSTAAQCASGPKAGVAQYKYETIYYPLDWKLWSRPGYTPGPERGIYLYRKYMWIQPSRPVGEPGWATIEITRWNCKECFRGEKAGSITDFVNDKNCAVPKCAYHETNCPVHSPELIPPAHLSKKCTLTTRFPMMTGGVCGRYYNREKEGDTYYYYFDGDTEGTDFSTPGEHLTEITAIFSKGGFVYAAELVCPKGEFDLYKKGFNYIIKNLTPGSRK